MKIFAPRPHDEMAHSPQGQPVSGTAADPAQARLLSELQACLPMLPVLAIQLKEVTRQVEEAVVKVCGSFQDMAQRARQAAAQVPLSNCGPASGGAAEEIGIDGLISRTRDTMGSLLLRIDQSSASSGTTAERMGSMERQIEDLRGTLRDVDEIAHNARVLALNGQIEAARAGAHGAAFSIVAVETAKMAQHAAASSKSIQKGIGEVSTNINRAAAELRQRAANDRHEATRSREEVNAALDAMMALHAGMQQAIDQAHRNSEQLARDISAAVTAMQFQDSVSQRIGHVVHALEEMHAALQAQAAPTAGDASQPSPPGAVAGDWGRRLAQRYTMDSERRVLAAHSSGQAATAAVTATSNLGDNVELF